MIGYFPGKSGYKRFCPWKVGGFTPDISPLMCCSPNAKNLTLQTLRHEKCRCPFLPNPPPFRPFYCCQMFSVHNKWHVAYSTMTPTNGYDEGLLVSCFLFCFSEIITFLNCFLLSNWRDFLPWTKSRKSFLPKWSDFFYNFQGSVHFSDFHLFFRNTDLLPLST